MEKNCTDFKLFCAKTILKFHFPGIFLKSLRLCGNSNDKNRELLFLVGCYFPSPNLNTVNVSSCLNLTAVLRYSYCPLCAADEDAQIQKDDTLGPLGLPSWPVGTWGLLSEFWFWSALSSFSVVPPGRAGDQ